MECKRGEMQCIPEFSWVGLLFSFSREGRGAGGALITGESSVAKNVFTLAYAMRPP